MKYVVAKVKCCGKAHEIRLSEAGAIVAPSHRGVHAVSAASVQAMGAPVRCLEVLWLWGQGVDDTANEATINAWRGLPEPLRRVIKHGFDKAFAYQAKRSPEAKRANRLTHAESKVRELDRRIKQLQTRRKGWVRKARRLAREVNG